MTHLSTNDDTSSAARPDVSPPRQPERTASRIRRIHPAWLLPIAVVVLVVLLTALDYNGSSIGRLVAPGSHDANLIAGTPRSIRSDEFRIATPNLIGNARRGMPVHTWIGLTQAFVPGTNIAIVSAHWTEIFKPQDWGFFVLPVDYAFALHWWLMLAIGLLGLYALLLALTRSIPVSASLATVGTLTPATAWWSNTPALIVGVAAASAACAVMALRHRPRVLPTGTYLARFRSGTPARLLWGAGAGYFATASLLFLYPPWQASLALVLVLLLVGVAIDARASWRAIAATVAGAVIVFVPSAGLWGLEARHALSAAAHTIYPGQRVSQSAGTNVGWLMDTLSSLALSEGHPPPLASSTSAINGTTVLSNSSEVSATWAPLPLLVGALTVLAWITRRRRAPEVGPGSEATRVDERGPPRLIASAWMAFIACAVLVAWAVVPLPPVVGQLTGLQEVDGSRITVALGVAVALTIALISVEARRSPPPPAVTAFLILSAVVTVVAMVWGAWTLPWTAAKPGIAALVIGALLIAAALTMQLSGRLTGWGAALAAIIAVGVFIPVNPLYRGLGPLDNDPVVATMRAYMHGHQSPRVAVYGDPALAPLVTASGAVDLSGVTPYPDHALWRRLDPQHEDRWNNYAVYYWVADTSIERPIIYGHRVARWMLKINPCSPLTLSLHIDLSLSNAPITDAPCLELAQVIHRRGADLYLYKTVTAVNR